MTETLTEWNKGGLRTIGDIDRYIEQQKEIHRQKRITHLMQSGSVRGKDLGITADDTAVNNENDNTASSFDYDDFIDIFLETQDSEKS